MTTARSLPLVLQLVQRAPAAHRRAAAVAGAERAARGAQRGGRRRERSPWERRCCSPGVVWLAAPHGHAWLGWALLAGGCRQAHLRAVAKLKCSAHAHRRLDPAGLFKFSLPILIANVLQSLNGSVNSIWVGRYLGEAALTATSNANTVMFLLIGAAFGVALAATILIGQYIGANNLARDQARGRHQRHVLRRAFPCCMAIAGLLLCRPLLHRHEHSGRFVAAGGGVHARDLPGAAIPLHVRVRHGGAARRGRLQDAVLFHAALGRHRHRAEPGVHLRPRARFRASASPAPRWRPSSRRP